MCFAICYLFFLSGLSWKEPESELFVQLAEDRLQVPDLLKPRRDPVQMRLKPSSRQNRRNFSGSSQFQQLPIANESGSILGEVSFVLLADAPEG